MDGAMIWMSVYYLQKFSIYYALLERYGMPCYLPLL